MCYRHKTLCLFFIKINLRKNLVNRQNSKKTTKQPILWVSVARIHSFLAPLVRTGAFFSVP